MEDKIYLLVAAEDGGEAERLGAHWDPVRLRWFIRHDQDPGPFLGWLPIEELEQEDELPDLCVAPPVFVAETAVACPACGLKSPVIGLMAERFSCGDEDGRTLLLGKATGAQNDAHGSSEPYGDGPYREASRSEDSENYGGGSFEGDEDEEFDGGEHGEESGLMRFQHIQTLPAEVAGFLGRHYPFFRKLSSPIGAHAFFANLCSCGEPLDDNYLHGEPGVGFYLFSREAALAVVLRELPTADPLLLRASFGTVVPDVILKFAPRQPFPADS